MSISLKKGGSISLTKEAPSLRHVIVGLGWQPNEDGKFDFDLDASAFMLTQDRVRSDDRFIFYGQRTSVCGSVQHAGDNTSGAEGEDADAEQIEVRMEAVPADVDRLAFTVTIHEAAARAQNFGQVEGAYIRLVNADTGKQVARFDLTEDFKTEIALEFGELYRDRNEWRFRAVGVGSRLGLDGLCKKFGVNVG